MCRAYIMPELAHPFLLCVRVWCVVTHECRLLTAGITVVLAPAPTSTNGYKEQNKV
jgi:hypothetical protein